MMATIEEMGGVRVLVCDAEGPTIDTERAGTDLIGDAMGEGASVIAVPVARLGAALFQLRNGLAGTITQKVVNYRMRLAVIGDVSGFTAASGPVRDWVREANAGRDIWFVADVAELRARLGG
jgi:hypothetical protein